MGMFFQKTQKSTKQMIVMRTVIAIAMVVLIVGAIMDDWNFFYFGLTFILAGLGAIIDTIESYFLKENKKVYLVHLGLAIVWFVLAFQFLT